MLLTSGLNHFDNHETHPRTRLKLSATLPHKKGPLRSSAATQNLRSALTSRSRSLHQDEPHGSLLRPATRPAAANPSLPDSHAPHSRTAPPKSPDDDPLQESHHPEQGSRHRPGCPHEHSELQPPAP